MRSVQARSAWSGRCRGESGGEIWAPPRLDGYGRSNSYALRIAVVSSVKEAPRVALKRLPLSSREVAKQKGIGGSTVRRRPPAGKAADPGNVARSQFARTFADVLSGRFGGRWDVEWQGANRPALPTDGDGRAFASKK